MNEKRIRDYKIEIGKIKTGKKNSITDVDGVKVGHSTMDICDIKTGVTAILPVEDNIFRKKVISASHVINGFGKSVGLVQIEELGTLETPIVLTNTFSVGTAYEALVKYMLKENKEIGKTTGTVNPVICECNDGYLSDIRGLHVKEEHIFKAIENASKDFEEGNIGAGTGMVCYGLKGGIGSSSRVINFDGVNYTIGVLVLTNFGLLENLIVNNKSIGAMIDSEIKSNQQEEKGSLITIVATDIPVSCRQLKRIIKRTYAGISRTGSFTGNGSGEIVIGFSTANRISHFEKSDLLDIKIINENSINEAFKATSEATEEAILNSLICSDTVIGRDIHKVYSLKEFIKFYK